MGVIAVCSGFAMVSPLEMGFSAEPVILGKLAGISGFKSRTEAHGVSDLKPETTGHSIFRRFEEFFEARILRVAQEV